MSKMVTYIVEGLVVAIVVGALAPTAFEKLSAFSTNGNLSSTEKSIAGVLGIFLILGLLYGFLRMAGIKLGK